MAAIRRSALSRKSSVLRYCVTVVRELVNIRGGKLMGRGGDSREGVSKY